jgi:hypothetical protein
MGSVGLIDDVGQGQSCPRAGMCSRRGRNGTLEHALGLGGVAATTKCLAERDRSPVALGRLGIGGQLKGQAKEIGRGQRSPASGCRVRSLFELGRNDLVRSVGGERQVPGAFLHTLDGPSEAPMCRAPIVVGSVCVDGAGKEWMAETNRSVVDADDLLTLGRVEVALHLPIQGGANARPGRISLSRDRQERLSRRGGQPVDPLPQQLLHVGRDR